MIKLFKDINRLSSSNNNRSFKYDKLLNIRRKDLKDLVKNCSYLEKVGNLVNYCVIVVKVNEEYALKLITKEKYEEILNNKGEFRKFPFILLEDLTNIVINTKYNKRRKTAENYLYREIKKNYNIVNFIIEEDFYSLKTKDLFIIKKEFINTDAKELYKDGLVLKGIDDFGSSYLYIEGRGEYKNLCKPVSYSMYSLVKELRKLGICGELDITSIIYDINKGKIYCKYSEGTFKDFKGYIKSKGSGIPYKNKKIYNIIYKFSKTNEKII